MSRSTEEFLQSDTGTKTHMMECAPDSQGSMHGKSITPNYKLWNRSSAAKPH